MAQSVFVNVQFFAGALSLDRIYSTRAENHLHVISESAILNLLVLLSFWQPPKRLPGTLVKGCCPHCINTLINQSVIGMVPGNSHNRLSNM
jgi:hypothetical protein